MTSLQAFPHQGVLVVDSRSIADDLGIKHPNLLQTIDKHLSVIEDHFGRVCFETRPFETAGGIQNIRVGYLNEAQSTFVGTLSRNTDRVVLFKARLVKAFVEAKIRFQQESPPQPKLPPHIEAVEVAKAIGTIHDELSDIDPRLAQILIDRAMQTVQPLALSDGNKPKLAGAVEIAESLGFSVGKEQSSLGKAVAKSWRDAYESDPQESKRECGGAMRKLKVYPVDDPIVVATVKEFYAEREVA